MIGLFEKSRLFSLTFAILIIAEIFYFSSQPGGIGSGSPWIARSYHFIIFFLLNFFIILTIKSKNKLNSKYILICVLFSVVFSIFDEIHQIFVPLRSASVVDILTDTLGILLSVIIYSAYDHKKIIS
jgi:VanZ family protein